MSKSLDPQVQKELEPSIQNYTTSTKRAVTSLQQMLEWAEEDMMVAQVELEKAIAAADKEEETTPTMKIVLLRRQYAFKLGLYEHIKGLLQTASDEDSWAKEASVHTRLGVEPNLTPPLWMQQAEFTQQQQQPIVQPPPSQQQQDPRIRRGSTYPAMSWIGESSLM